MLKHPQYATDLHAAIQARTDLAMSNVLDGLDDSSSLTFLDRAWWAAFNLAEQCSPGCAAPLMFRQHPELMDAWFKGQIEAANAHLAPLDRLVAYAKARGHLARVNGELVEVMTQVRRPFEGWVIAKASAKSMAELVALVGK